MPKHPQLEVVDEVFYDCQAKANPLKYLSPTNDLAAWQKGIQGDRLPPLTYPPIDYDTKEVNTVLRELVIPDSPLKKLYEAKREELLINNQLVAERDNPERVQELSKQLYGTPSKALILRAEEILRTPVKDLVFDEKSEHVLRALQQELKNLGIEGWKIEYSEKHATTAYPAEQKITLCKQRTFAHGEAKRLCVHEIGVHVLRAWNGAQQPYGIFALGFPGYTESEEGLAMYCEELTETTDSVALRKYAARVIATDSLARGKTMVVAYDTLSKYPAFAEGKGIWDVVLRVYRSGGFYKDHLYLQGYLAVKEYAEKGGDLPLLWIGKFGLADVPFVKELLKEKEIEKARKLPDFL